ncbi:MAG: NTP transferase domain-containing protein [Candidatus Kapaibacterium sp.]
MQITAVILAAGSGKRIGTPKLKLKSGNEFFVNIITNNLKSEGINDIVCIIRKDDLEWFKENAAVSDYIINDNPESGMISSVRLGVEMYKQKGGILLFPVDHPFVTGNTIKNLMTYFGKNKDSVIKPYYKDKSGHPIIVPNSLFKYILKSNNSKSLNGIIRESLISVVKTDIDDECILRNINSPEDLNIQ